MESWVGGADADCCSWDGVVCNVMTGHVIGLHLNFSCISGTFPSNSTLFSLTHLQHLHLAFNDFKLSPIPSEISMLQSLKSLVLRNSNFCCQIPSAISKLLNLSRLDISYNYLSGPIPSSFSNLTMLTNLGLSNINLTGKFVPGSFSSWLPKLHNLESLWLSEIKVPSEMPSLLANLTRLKILDLQQSYLTGPVIPHEFANLSQLQALYLASNYLEGPIPHWMSQLTNLEMLDLSLNDLYGNIHIFSNLKGLRFLGLSGVKLTFPPYSRTNTTLFKLHDLYLSSCNLIEFPQFLRDQDELKFLFISNNSIKGSVPQWLSDITKESLLYIDISDNQLTGFEQSLAVLPWTHLETLDVGGNQFQGKLPTLPRSLQYCDFSNNLLAGLIPTSICQARSLVYLDLSSNSMRGEIPDCSGHQYIGSLQVLNLQNNSLSGLIPNEICRATSLIYRLLQQHHEWSYS